MEARIREIFARNTFLPVAESTLGAEDDLYKAGLTSFASVQLMLALEEAFDIEFPERMLNRRSFASIAAIAACVGELTGTAV